MKVAQVPKAGADFEIVEREIPNPGAREVRIKVQACGVCHSDSLTKEGEWPGIQYPRAPGHEVVGIVDEVPRNKWKTANASASAGTAGTTIRATHAGAVILETVAT